MDFHLQILFVPLFALLYLGAIAKNCSEMHDLLNEDLLDFDLPKKIDPDKRMRDQFMASVTGVATSGEAMYRCNRFMCYYNYLMRLPLDAVKNCMDYDVFNNHSNWYWNPNNNWMAPFIFVVESDKIKEDYKILRNLHGTSFSLRSLIMMIRNNTNVEDRHWSVILHRGDENQFAFQFKETDSSNTSWPFDQYHLVMNMAISGWASNYIKHELYDYKIHDKRREERIPVVPTKSTSAPVSVLPQISLTWLLVLSIVIVTFILVVSGIYLWWYLVQKSKDDERAKMVRKEIIVRQNEVNKNTEYDDTNPEFNKDE